MYRRAPPEVAMSPRNNLLNLYRRGLYGTAPVVFQLCPDLERRFHGRYPAATDYREHFQFPMRLIADPGFPWIAEIPGFVPQRRSDFNRSTIHRSSPAQDGYLGHRPRAGRTGVQAHDAHASSARTTRQPGAVPSLSLARIRQSRLVVPAARSGGDSDAGTGGSGLDGMHDLGDRLVPGRMDLLMLDMAAEDEKAVFLLDKLTDLACFRADSFAEAGADILMLGDDLGMQRSIMMSASMYRTWLKPRLKRVIDAAKAVKPDILIQYHSCGYATPLIPDLIEAGIDILNPVQPECMDVEQVLREFGGQLSFNGTHRHPDDDALWYAGRGPGDGPSQPGTGRPARGPVLLPHAHAGTGGAVGEYRSLRRRLPGVESVVRSLRDRTWPGRQCPACPFCDLRRRNEPRDNALFLVKSRRWE